MVQGKDTVKLGAEECSVSQLTGLVADLIGETGEKFEVLAWLLSAKSEHLKAISKLRIQLESIMAEMNISTIIVSERLPQLTDTKLWLERDQGYYFGSLIDRHSIEMEDLCRNREDALFIIRMHTLSLLDLHLRHAIDTDSTRRDN